MRSCPPSAAALVAALSLPLLAHGQSGPAMPAGNPARVESPAPATAYRSPFANYRPHVAVTPGPWRGLNDEVARIGGWKAYAREAHEAAEAAKASSQSMPAPAASAPASR